MHMTKNTPGNLNKEDRYAKMKEIRDELLNFTESPLYKYRTENKYFPVVGEGSHMAHIMFVGEAPGKTEAETARPFCGRSGKLLDEMIASIGLKREDVYITNVVKDRPQDNRDPLPSEIELYAPFLDRQMDIIQPKVIVGLGRFSGVYLMNKLGIGDQVTSISTMHGKEYIGNASYGSVTIVPLYHPAVALYDGSKKVELMQDFAVLQKYI
jgi:uracil-DNA glycosylase family 4